MDLGLRDRVALVTGASRGIGRAIAEALASEGASVAVAARSAAGVAAAADAIGGRGYVFDSDDLAAVDPLVDAVRADLGEIDVYVVNTGGPPRARRCRRRGSARRRRSPTLRCSCARRARAT